MASPQELALIRLYQTLPPPRRNARLADIFRAAGSGADALFKSLYEGSGLGAIDAYSRTQKRNPPKQMKAFDRFVKSLQRSGGDFALMGGTIRPFMGAKLAEGGLFPGGPNPYTKQTVRIPRLQRKDHWSGKEQIPEDTGREPGLYFEDLDTLVMSPRNAAYDDWHHGDVFNTFMGLGHEEMASTYGRMYRHQFAPPPDRHNPNTWDKIIQVDAFPETPPRLRGRDWDVSRRESNLFVYEHPENVPNQMLARLQREYPHIPTENYKFLPTRGSGVKNLTDQPPTSAQRAFLLKARILAAREARRLRNPPPPQPRPKSGIRRTPSGRPDYEETFMTKEEAARLKFANMPRTQAPAPPPARPAPPRPIDRGPLQQFMTPAQRAKHELLLLSINSRRRGGM